MNQSPPELLAPYKAPLVEHARALLRAAGTDGIAFEIPGMAVPCTMVLGATDRVAQLMRTDSREPMLGGRRVGDPPAPVLTFEGEQPVAAAPAAQAATDGVHWDLLPSYLIDHCEGNEITEEGLQGAVASMLKHPDYLAAVAAIPSPAAAVQTEQAELVELLRDLRPIYGAVGSRDVDVAAQQQRIDRAIELIEGRTQAGGADAVEVPQK